MRLRLILATTAIATLAGCVHPVDTDNSPTFGQSVNTMIAAQTSATPATDEPPQSSGAAGARAVDAYANAPPPPPPLINLNLSTTED